MSTVSVNPTFMGWESNVFEVLEYLGNPWVTLANPANLTPILTLSQRVIKGVRLTLTVHISDFGSYLNHEHSSQLVIADNFG